MLSWISHRSTFIGYKRWCHHPSNVRLGFVFEIQLIRDIQWEAAMCVANRSTKSDRRRPQILQEDIFVIRCFDFLPTFPHTHTQRKKPFRVRIKEKMEAGTRLLSPSPPPKQARTYIRNPSFGSGSQQFLLLFATLYSCLGFKSCFLCPCAVCSLRMLIYLIYRHYHMVIVFWVASESVKSTGRCLL